MLTKNSDEINTLEDWIMKVKLLDKQLEQLPDPCPVPRVVLTTKPRAVAAWPFPTTWPLAGTNVLEQPPIFKEQ